MSPDDDEQAQHVALVISQVFSEPVPDAPLASYKTLTEALQRGITGQLAVLDDVSLTGTGQSAADVLGASGAALAEKLTDHLLWQIMVRGSRGGPLQPLADQLNHEMTRQQTHDAVREFGSKILEAIARQDATRTAEQAGSQMSADVALYVGQLLDELVLGGHEEAERRVNRLFIRLFPRSAGGRGRGNHPRGHDDQGSHV